MPSSVLRLGKLLLALEVCCGGAVFLVLGVISTRGESCLSWSTTGSNKHDMLANIYFFFLKMMTIFNLAYSDY